MENNATDENKGAQSAQKPKLTFKENKVLFIKMKFFSLLKMIWNPKKKQFLNKDGEDWLYISLYYIVFYLAIGLFTWAIMAIFMAITKSNHTIKPRYPGQNGVLYRSTFSPGMAVKPHIGTDIAAIKFSTSDPSQYVNFLNIYLQPYETSIKNTIPCNITQTIAPSNQSCTYDIFNYLTSLGCNSTENFGYSAGLPCVLLKINNVFDWRPTGAQLPPNNTFSSSPMCNNTIASIRARRNVSTNYIFITCKGQKPDDDKNILSMQYSSPYSLNDPCIAGIPFYFYPYENVAHYMQPLIPLQLNLTRDTTVNIECYAWARGLVQKKDSGYGYVKFSMTVKSPTADITDINSVL